MKIDKKTDKGRKFTHWNILIVVLIFYLLPYYYAKLLTWPCAEDYTSMPFDGFSFTRALADSWYAYLNWGGRYLCYGTGQLVSYMLFRHAAYCGLCIFTGIIAFIPIAGIISQLDKQKSRSEKLFWSLLFFAAAYSTLGGLSQTFYWASNIFSATFALIALMYGIWAVCYLWKHKNFSYFAFSVAIIAGFIVPGFYEHAAIAQFFIAIIILICAWKDRRHRAAFIFLAVWEIFWVAAMLLAPGNLQRQQVQASANSFMESLFMAVRALVGVGLRTLFSPWLFIFPAFAIAYKDRGEGWVLKQTFKLRAILSIIALIVPVVLVSLHVMARYPISFSVRSGDSLLIISWIALTWVILLNSDWMVNWFERFRFTRYLPIIAVTFVFLTYNTFTIWKNTINGSLAAYDQTMREREIIFRNGRGKDVVVLPLACTAWPAQKVQLGEIAYNLDISKRFGLHSLRLAPLVEDIRNFMSKNPGKLSVRTIKDIPIGWKGIDSMRATLIKDVPVGDMKEDWLEIQITGTEESLSRIRYLRIITMTDKCFSPVLRFFYKKTAFRRISPVMALAIYGSWENHVNYDLHNPATPIVKNKLLKQDRYNWSLLLPLKGTRQAHTDIIFCTLDTKTYFKIYQKQP